MNKAQRTGTAWKLSSVEVGISEAPNCATRLQRHTVVSVVELTTEQPSVHHASAASSKYLHWIDLSDSISTSVMSSLALLSVKNNISLPLRPNMHQHRALLSSSTTLSFLYNRPTGLG